MKNLVFALMAAACSAYAGLVDIDGDPVTTNTMLGSVDQESGTVGDLLELKAVPDGEIRRIAREEAEQVTVGATNALTVAMTNRYTKAETDGLLDGKTDKTNTYTKAEVNGLVDAAGKVKSVNGKDGEVVLTASDVHALPDTYTPPVQPTDTNAVRDIIRDEITPATNSLYTTLNGSIDVKRDKTDLAVYEVVRTENTDWTLTTNVVDRLATTNGVNAAVSSKMDKVITPSRGFLIADENGNAKPSFMVDEITIGEIQYSLNTKADKATTLSGYGITDAAPLSMISETNPTFSNAVATVARTVTPPQSPTLRLYDEVRQCYWIGRMVNGVINWEVE